MMRELRQAVRSLRAWRFGALAAVLTLAVGIGSATSMYALVRMALLSTMPDIEDVPAVGRVFASSRSLGIERSHLAVKDLPVVATASSFDSIGAYAIDDGELGAGGEPMSIAVGAVSGGFFRAMRTYASAGRLISDADVREASPVVVVSDRVWRAQLAGRPPIGAVITIDGSPRTVIGVLPPGFGFSFIGIKADAWIPLAASAQDRKIAILARLAPGRTWAAASAELEALGRSRNPNGLWTWTAITAEQDLRKRTAGGVAMMFGPAFVILLIGCTNVACMLLARGVDRDVELSVRSAMGATRPRLVAQLLAENLVLAVTGGVLGGMLAYWLLKVIAAAIAQVQPESGLALPSAGAMAATAAAFSLGACLLFGAIPAIRLSRRDIVSSLKGTTPLASARFVGYRARDLIVFVEIGVAVGLVVTTAMFVRFFVELERVTPLFPASEVVAVRIPAPELAGATARVLSLPGVAGVSAASDMPGVGRSASAATLRTSTGRNGRATLVGVGPAFFTTTGVPLLRGRPFAAADAHAPVAILSDAAAAALWPGADPLGTAVTIGARERTFTATIVGIAGNAMETGGLMRSGLVAPDVYIPLDAATAGDVLLFARAAGDARNLVRPVAAAVRPSPTARAPRASVVSADFVHDDSLLVVRLLGAFGVLALLLAGSGIFGVLSQSVAQRTTEFGVRMAVGASPGQVLRMVLAREGKLIAAGIASGIAVTLLVTRSTFAEMLLISGTDPRMWAVVAVVCGGVAAVAVMLATWRIVTLDPWQVLRTG